MLAVVVKGTALGNRVGLSERRQLKVRLLEMITVNLENIARLLRIDITVIPWASGKV